MFSWCNLKSRPIVPVNYKLIKRYIYIYIITVYSNDGCEICSLVKASGDSEICTMSFSICPMIHILAVRFVTRHIKKRTAAEGKQVFCDFMFLGLQVISPLSSY